MSRYLWLAVVGAALGPPSPGAAARTPNAMADESPLAAAKSARPEPPYLVELDVPGYGAAVVAVPAPSAGAEAPLVVAAHGAWDRPEWHCALWQRLVHARAFVLCPRGRATLGYLPPDDQLFYFPDHFALGREIARAMDALAARFGGAVDLSRPLYAGFSQGAIDGALLLPHHAARFARAALVEGGNGEFDEWGHGPAALLARQGGERVLIACGRAHCAEAAHRSARLLGSAGVDAEVLYVPGVGHTYGAEMEAALGRAMAWLFDGDARWSSVSRVERPDPMAQ